MNILFANAKKAIFDRPERYISRKQFKKNRNDLEKFGSHVVVDMTDSCGWSPDLVDAKHPDGTLEIVADRLYASPDHRGAPNIETLIYRNSGNESGYMEMRTGKYRKVVTENVRSTWIEDSAVDHIEIRTTKEPSYKKTVRIKNVEGLKTFELDKNTLDNLDQLYLDIADDVESGNPEIDLIHFPGIDGKNETLLTNGEIYFWRGEKGDGDAIKKAVAERIKSAEEELQENKNQLLALQNVQAQLDNLVKPGLQG